VSRTTLMNKTELLRGTKKNRTFNRNWERATMGRTGNARQEKITQVKIQKDNSLEYPWGGQNFKKTEKTKVKITFKGMKRGSRELKQKVGKSETFAIAKGRRRKR